MVHIEDGVLPEGVSSATPVQVPPLGVLGEAMQDAWNEFCSDTGCVPDAFHIHGPRTTRVVADFSKGNFVEWVLARIEAAGYRLLRTGHYSEDCDDPWVCCIHTPPKDGES